MRRARQVGRGGARRAAGARAPERHAADERDGRQAGDDAGGSTVDGVVVERDGETETYAADVVVLACGAANTAKLLLGRRPTSTRTGSRTAPTRSAATTCSTTARPCWRSRRTRTRPCSRRRSASTTSTSPGNGREYPLGQHPDGRQVAGADVPRREAGRDEARAALDAGGGRRARGRLLALDRGPADAGEPRHRRPRRQADARLHGDERRSRRSELTSSCSSMLGQAAHGARTTSSTASRT